jgi:hypothetical protein
MGSSRTFPDLIEALGSDGEREAACLELAALAWSKDMTAALRLTTSALAGLIILFQPQQLENVPAPLDGPQRELGPKELLVQCAALQIAFKAATIDILFKEALITGDAIRKVREGSFPGKRRTDA